MDGKREGGMERGREKDGWREGGREREMDRWVDERKEE